MNPSIRLAHEAREHARRLELQVATTRLLTHLFPEGNGRGATPGRYQFLEKGIEQHPKLVQALLDSKREVSVQREWSQILADHQSDARFLHGLAVMYREQALASLERGKPDGHPWILSTTLWGLLLCTVEFWEYFSEARFTERNSGERLPLGPEQQDALFHKTLQGILSLHSTQGRRDLAAGRHEQAHVHLRCLDLCRTGGEALVVTLDEYSLPVNLNLEDSRLQRVTSIARNLLDDWGATLVREAEKVTEDAEAIKSLPKGIRKNYEGGIRYLEPFIKLNIPEVRVLRTSLEWYNDWCYDLYVTREIERIKALMLSARLVADQLAPLCIKGRGYPPENQALSQHFLLRGFATDEPEHATKEYKEALEWNPGNDNAEQLLGQAAQEVLMRQLQTAIECMERKQFREAYEVLDAVEEKATDKERVRGTRAVVCFRHANALADGGKFRDALIQAREALRLEPAHPVVKKFAAEMEEIAPEEDNLRYLREAQEAFEKARYDRAIKSASQVSAQSKFQRDARRLQSGAHFYRGIAAAKQERFDRAESDLKRALELNDNREEREIISRQLEVVKEGDNVRYLQSAQKAMQKELYDQAIKGASQISTQSRYHDEARRLQSAAYFQRGVAAAKQEQFDKAEMDLKRALDLNDDRREREIIASQLEIIQQNRTGYELKQALDRRNWSKAEQILRNALKEQPSQQVRRELESQLSHVLNAHAVSLVSEVQGIEQEFGDALTDIISRVKRRQGVR